MPRTKVVSDADVLSAAARVVARSGPKGTTLGAVASECGLSPATLVQRFGSKRGLLLALSGASAEGVHEVFAAARAKHADPLDALVAGLVAMTRSVRTPEAIAHSVAFLALDLGDPEFLARARAHAYARRREIEALLREAGLDPALARAVDVTYNGSLITWAVDPEGPLAARLEEDLRALLVRA